MAPKCDNKTPHLSPRKVLGVHRIDTTQPLKYNFRSLGKTPSTNGYSIAAYRDNDVPEIKQDLMTFDIAKEDNKRIRQIKFGYLKGPIFS